MIVIKGSPVYFLLIKVDCFAGAFNAHPQPKACQTGSKNIIFTWSQFDPSSVTGRTRKIHLKKPLSQRAAEPRMLWLWDISANHCTSLWPKNLLFVCLYYDSDKSLMYVHTAVFHRRFPFFSFQGGKNGEDFVLNTHWNMCNALRGVTNILRNLL